MNKLSTMLSLTVLCLAMKANAQQPAPATAPASDPPVPASDPPAPAAAPKKPPKTTAQSEAGEPRANTSRTPATARPPAGPAQKAPGATDRLELGTATVTGDREQPKVMYIVPWKKSDIGDLAGKPMNSLVDEILAPVDRDVFKREVVYFKAVQADASQNGAPGRPSEQVEK
jgi:hypothetical protein